MQTIDPTDTQLHPLSEYSKRLPSRRPGRRLNRATLWRWALDGARGWKLRTVEIGGGRFTCDAWVWEFIHRRPTSPFAPCALPPISPEERARIQASLAPKHRRRAA